MNLSRYPLSTTVRPSAQSDLGVPAASASMSSAQSELGLEAIFKAHHHQVCRAIYRLIRESATMEDLAQNVFIRFWERRHSIRINGCVGAYLRRMGINEALAHLRRHQRHRTEEWTGQADTGSGNWACSCEQLYLYAELQSEIREAIEQLPPRCRTIFQLSRQQGLTYREIANQLSISVKTVEHQISKALKILRLELNVYLSEYKI